MRSTRLILIAGRLAALGLVFLVRLGGADMKQLWDKKRKWGLILPAATILILTTYAIAADPDFWVKAGTFDPADTDLVSAQWVEAAGCPTSAGVATYPSTIINGTFADPGCPTGDPKDKENAGLVLIKTGPTSNNAAAGAELKGVKGLTLTELGYDIRSGGHCGAGAPRFNVQATDGFHFIGGCSNGTVPFSSPAWKRVRFDPANPAQAFPVIASGATVISIEIVFDEGTDTGSDFSGLAVLDNIDVNGTLVGRGKTEESHKGERKHED